jgi:hypothetical protein
MSESFRKELVAPCGMNCGICVAFFGYTMSGKKRKMKCVGCHPSGKSCAHLKKYCETLLKNEIRYCYECNMFPCVHLQRLDEKYRKRYGMSMIDNLACIQDNGMDAFLRQQEKRYTCPDCGGVICVHTGICYTCSPPE